MAGALRGDTQAASGRMADRGDYVGRRLGSDDVGRLDAATGHARAGMALDHLVGSPVWVARSGKLLAQVTA